MLIKLTDIVADHRREALHHQQIYKAACEGDVRLGALSKKMGLLGFEKLKRTLAGRKTEDLDIQMHEITIRYNERLSQLGLRQYLCTRCEDRGTVDGRYCTCLLERIYRDYYGGADLRDQQIDLAAYPDKILDESRNVEDYGATARSMTATAVDAFEHLLKAYPNQGRGILLVGKTGVGKSFLAQAAAGEAYRRGIDTLYLNAVQMHDLYHRQRVYHDVDLQMLENSGLLFVDDLGTEPKTRNVTVESVYRVIEERHRKLLPTVFITNLTNYLEAYDERISSRLLDDSRFQYLPLAGTDLRRVVRRPVSLPDALDDLTEEDDEFLEFDSWDHCENRLFW